MEIYTKNKNHTINYEGQILPIMDSRTICPFDDIEILNFYKPYFDCVFVALHPFYKKNKNISWKEILDITKFKNISELDLALRTSIGGLNEEFKEEKLAEILQEKIEKLDIETPFEGDLDMYQMSVLLKKLKNIGYNWLCLGGEFGESMQMKSIDFLLDNLETIDVKNMYTYDKKILITTHWDSFQTYICGEKSIIQKLLSDNKIEGFYADKNTKIYWSCEK